jgi:chromate transporter
VTDNALGQLALDFALLSLIAVGGAVPILPEMQRMVVDNHGWMSASTFADLFALAQAAPGPNVLVVSLIGWKVAGLAGAAVATAAMITPSSVLTYAVARAWERFRDARWRKAIQRGLAPVTIGLMTGAAYLLTRAADESLSAYALTAFTALVVVLTRLHPLWLIGLGAVLGLGGVV